MPGENAFSSLGDVLAAPTVTGLTLIEGGTDRPRGLLTDGQTISLARGETFNIAAETTPETGSVLFYLDGHLHRTANQAPFIMGTDPDGGYSEWLLPIGEHVIEAVAYADPDGEGLRGGSVRVRVTVEAAVETAAPPPATDLSFGVTGLKKVSEEPFAARPLQEDDIIDLHETGPVRIVAETDATTVGSIRYWLNGRPFRIENLDPKAARSDRGDAFEKWNLSSGYHHVLAVPYSGKDATGEAGRSFEARVGVVNGEPVVDSATEAKASIAAAKLRWARPKMTNATTVTVKASKKHAWLDLDTKKDYYVKLPNVRWEGGVTINGGRNIIIVGGHIVIPGSTLAKEIRGILIDGATGTVHIEGVYFFGKGEGDAISIRAPQAIVQIQNIRVDSLKGSENGIHGDIVQPWGGVEQLRINNLTGSSDYQGLQINRDGGPIGKSFVSRVNLRALKERFKGAKGGYMIWTNRYPIYFDQVYVQPRQGVGLNKSVSPETGNTTASWSYATGVVRKGSPSGGDFVRSGVAGLNYK